MSKQDRVAPRTAEDIERKTNFKQTFAQFAGLVGDAERAAMEAEAAAKAASDAVKNLDSELDQDEIFNRLTNNGESQGMYRDEKGDIYMNLSYLKGGKIVAEGQTYLRPTYEDCLAMLRSVSFPSQYPAKDFYDLNGDGTFDVNDVRLAQNVFYGVSDISECVSLEKSTVTVTIEPNNPHETVKISGTNMWGSEVVIVLGANSTKIPVISGDCSIGGQLTVRDSAMIPSLALNAGGEPKSLSWKDNGDGTYTLIGS